MNPQLPPVGGRGYRPKSIFDAPSTPSNPQPAGQQPGPKNHKKFILIIIGAVVLILIVAIIIAVLIGKRQVKQTSNSTSGSSSNSQRNQAAQDPATSFAKAILSSQTDQAWSLTSAPFQQAVPRDKFNAMVQPLQAYIGSSSSVDLIDSQQSDAVTIKGTSGSVKAASYVFAVKKSSSDQSPSEYMMVDIADFNGQWLVYYLQYQPTKLSASTASTGQYYVNP